MTYELELKKLKEEYDKATADIKKVLRLIKVATLKDGIDDWWVDESEDTIYVDIERPETATSSKYFSTKFPACYLDMLANGEEEEIKNDYFNISSKYEREIAND